MYPLRASIMPIADYIKDAVAATAVVASAIVGIRSLNKNIRINLRNKRVDVVMHCNARYDQIYDVKTQLKNTSESLNIDAAIQSYYSRYWGLKSDEFDYWLADLIDLETYCNWSFMTMKAFQENDFACPLKTERDFVWGWKEVGRNDNLVTNEWFYELTEATREVARIWAVHLDKFPQLRNSEPLRKRLYTEMIDILEIVFVESEDYRKTLLDGLSFEDYRKTLEKHPILGLSIAERKSNVRLELEELVSA